MWLLGRGHCWRDMSGLGEKVVSSLVFEVSGRSLSQGKRNRLSFRLTSRLPLALVTSLILESFFISLRSSGFFFFFLFPAESSFIISPKVLQREKRSLRSQSCLWTYTLHLSLVFLSCRVTGFDLLSLYFFFYFNLFAVFQQSDFTNNLFLLPCSSFGSLNQWINVIASTLEMPFFQISFGGV